jgi:transposase InsO family protein
MCLKTINANVENELGRKIKTIRSDNGKEYCNKEFESFLIRYGIEHQTSTPYSPQQNGLAERMNRTLVERAKCMLFDAQLSKKFWPEAVATAAYIVNRSPTKSVNGKTPIEMWTGKKPNLSNMKIFGSEVMVQVPKEKRQKWDSKSRKLCLLDIVNPVRDIGYLI